MLNRSSFESALFCVLLLSEVDKGQTLSSSAMASYFDLSPTYLSKVLKALVKSGILISYFGKSGGYRIEPDLGNVTLMDIVEAVEPNQTLHFQLERLETRMACLHAPRSSPVADGIAAAASVWVAELASISVASLLEGRKANEPMEATAYRKAFVKAFQKELPHDAARLCLATSSRYRSHHAR